MPVEWEHSGLAGEVLAGLPPLGTMARVTLDSFLARFRRSVGGGPGDTAPVARLERFIEVADFLTAIDLRAGERA